MSETDHSPAGTGELSQGDQVDGMELRRLIAADEFCSLWETAPPDHAVFDACLRVIPAGHLRCADAEERFLSELEPWEEMKGKDVVELVDHGRRGDYYFMLMRYFRRGSVERQCDDWAGSRLAEFAVRFAAALGQVHSRMGAHGNLKPGNVFCHGRKSVLLSDFMLPLWLDEMEAGSEALHSRLVHSYRAPEQVEEPGSYTKASDVYAFALVLLRCLLGRDPASIENPLEAPWPSELTFVMGKCLQQDPEQRFGDGAELYDALRRDTGLEVEAAPVAGSAEAAAPPGQPDEELVAEQLEAAREKVREGYLHEAVGLLESVPAGTEGMDELLDEIEQSREESNRLVEESLRLAEGGEREAAVKALNRAYEICRDSATIASLKEGIAGPEEGAAPAPAGGPGSPLVEALEEGRYSVARPLLENQIREQGITGELREAVRRFKRGRVRKSFLNNVRAARRLYLAGEKEKAAEHWLEAARWLPPGSERERLRRIAREATRGKLHLDTEALAGAGEGPAVAQPWADEGEGKPAAPGGGRKLLKTAILVVLAVLALVLLLAIIL